jgi:N-acetylglucosaminyl-diphospho-decaprenol L-rhamnosyltransferase
MVDLSLVLVGFHSSGVAGEAMASFRAEVSRIGARGEVVVVDHSEDTDEAARLERLAPDHLFVERNRGYAAGVNAGIAASTGAVVLVGNPDIRMAAGSLEALLESLGSGWGIVGPQFELAGILLPPADVQTPREEFRRWRASRSHRFWRRYFGAEVQRWRRVWDAREPVAVPNLSGALVGFRRQVAEKVGPWDEGYFLYFEETDWLRRAASKGLRIAQVPAARVEHRWGHAADPHAMGSHLLRSRSRFFRAHFGLMGRIVAGVKPTRTPLHPQPIADGFASLPAGELLWLLSPTSLGFPAGGFAGTASACIRTVRGFFDALPRPSRHLLLAVEPVSGNLFGPWSWERGNG